MNDITNLGDTVKPKSDQLNADDLITGPIDVLITGVRRGSADQPIIIDIIGMMPFKPCKTMRRLLIMAWGQDGNGWVGKTMRLYNDQTVKWAGKAIGGIRISHLSHIQQSASYMLTATRGKRAEHTIHPIDFTAIIHQYAETPKESQQALWETLNPSQQNAVSQALTGAH